MTIPNPDKVAELARKLKEERKVQEVELEPISYKEAELIVIARERNMTLESLRTTEFTPESLDWQKQWIKNLKSSEKYYFVYEDDGRFVGYCGLDKIDFINKIAEISLLIRHDERGRGLGALAIKKLLKKAFGYFHLNTVYAEVYDTTKTVYFWLNQGFQIDGFRANTKLWEDKWYGSYLMSAHKERHEN